MTPRRMGGSEARAVGVHLLVDFGSTYTKVTAVDLDEEVILGRAQSPTTIATDGTWRISDPAAAGNLTRMSTAAPAVTIGRPAPERCSLALVFFERLPAADFPHFTPGQGRIALRSPPRGNTPLPSRCGRAR